MSRIDHLREKFKTSEIDGMLVTSSSNRRYLSNFTGTAGVLLISTSKAKLITDFRYIDQANEQASEFEIIQHTGAIQAEIAKQAHELGIKKLGFEQDYLTYSTYNTYDEIIEAELVPITGLIEKLRLIKDSSELKILKEAAEIADATFEHIVNYIKPGMTELEVSNELEFFIRDQGATSSSFAIIVASGVRSALPHGVASNKIIKNGEFVTLDFGALYKGYCSDITRTVAVGEPIDELKKIYDIVLQAQLRGLQEIKPGITGKHADQIPRDYITEHGYGEYFGHSTGHGIGLDVHEGPSLSSKSDVSLEPGMVVTVEPGIYMSGLGGVRIEDDTVITEAGNEKLTHSTKDLLIIGE
jgi:Xaa-Pro aminopeptidase